VFSGTGWLGIGDALLERTGPRFSVDFMEPQVLVDCGRGNQILMRSTLSLTRQCQFIKVSVIGFSLVGLEVVHAKLHRLYWDLFRSRCFQCFLLCCCSTSLFIVSASTSLDQVPNGKARRILFIFLLCISIIIHLSGFWRVGLLREQ